MKVDRQLNREELLDNLEAVGSVLDIIPFQFGG